MCIPIFFFSCWVVVSVCSFHCVCMIQRENYAFNYQGFDQIDKRKKRKKIAHRALDEHWLSPASSQKCWHSIDSNVAYGLGGKKIARYEKNTQRLNTHTYNQRSSLLKWTSSILFCSIHLLWSLGP